MEKAATTLKTRVAALRERHRELRRNGAGGLELAHSFADAAADVVREAWTAALTAECVSEKEIAAGVALVAVGGFGRRELCPFSDIDLVIVHSPRSDDRLPAVVKRAVREIWDAGLALGQNVATLKQLLTQAKTDVTLATGLFSARPIWGADKLASDLSEQFRKSVVNGGRAKLEQQLDASMTEEFQRFGATAHLVEPNVKRSAGGLRHVQYIHWSGLLRGVGETFADFERAGLLGVGDAQTLEEANDFLLKLRAELHFQAGKAADSLTRGEQLRIAALWNYGDGEGMLAVERFMRDCLRRTTAVADVAERFADRNRRSAGWRAMLGAFTARVLEPGVQLQAGRLELSPETRAAACASLEKLLELAALAASHGACFDPATAEALRARTRVDGETNAPVSAAASASFLQMLSHSGGANRIVRQLHQTGALAAVLPEFERIRCLIQFNAYHRYTVDEHTLVMLEKVESFGANGRGDAPARGYARVRRRELLHLAVLLHDLGKGVDEDHSEVGMRIAHAASDRLGLSGADRRTLVFLVHKHLLLSRLAFQRDTRDPAVLLQLVRAVGREEMLHKLYCLTVADVMAVSPEAYTQWKADLLEDLYRRALAWFGEGGEAGEGALEAPTAPEIAGFDGDEEAKSWLLLLPAERLRSLSAGELKELGAARRRLAAEGVVTLFRYDPARDAATLTVLTHESLTGGIFHKICGALAAHHLEVLAAHIHTFAGGGVLDVFEVRDIHHTGAPSPERRQRISATVARVLKGELTVDDALWSSRSSLFVARTRVIPSDSIRIEIDNESCADCTIVDVFAHDRRGLLYTQARTLFKLGLSITFAKIATYSDEVVDVFYLRDSEGRKIEADEDCQRIRTEMTRALERLATDPRSMGF